MRDSDLEYSTELVEAARDQRIARLRKQLADPGQSWCGDCGAEIEIARRIAAPFARRCVACQGAHERATRRVW